MKNLSLKSLVIVLGLAIGSLVVGENFTGKSRNPISSDITKDSVEHRIEKNHGLITNAYMVGILLLKEAMD